MKNSYALSTLVGLLLSMSAVAQNAQSPTSTIDPLPRDLEIQLALSALPPHLRENATVYVLNPAKGFEVARKGTNGFHAFVNRTGEDACEALQDQNSVVLTELQRTVALRCGTTL